MKPQESCLLEVRDLHLRIEDRWLARDLSFSLSKGEFIGIIGSSGSGKTTLLQAINGETKAESGSIKIGAESKLPVGMIPQDLELAEGSSALNNALSGSLLRHAWTDTLFGFPKEEKEKAFELLDTLGLSRKVNQWTSTLSRGERQRLAIVRTLLAEPLILLADEPVASLDSDWAIKTLDLLKDFAKQKQAGVICSLHDPKQVEEFADKVIRIDSTNPEQWKVEELS